VQKAVRIGIALVADPVMASTFRMMLSIAILEIFWRDSHAPMPLMQVSTGGYVLPPMPALA
jgi:hypothetical protein